MPYTKNELVQVKLRVQNSLNEYPGRSRDYFIAVSGPGIQLGNEDPKIAPRCRLIRQNIWEKELWLPKECRINYKFLVVYSFTGAVKDIETVVSRHLEVGHFPVTMEHVYNKTGERKIVETKKRVNRCQNRNGSYRNFSKPEYQNPESENKCVTQLIKSGGNIRNSEDELKVENKVPVATDHMTKQDGVHTQVIDTQIYGNYLTHSSELDSEKIQFEAATFLPESEINQTLQAEDTTKVLDDPSTRYIKVNQIVQPESYDQVNIKLESNEMEDSTGISTTQNVITTTESATCTNEVSDKMGGNYGGIFGGKCVIVAVSCIALAGLGYFAFSRK